MVSPVVFDHTSSEQAQNSRVSPSLLSHRQHDKPNHEPWDEPPALSCDAIISSNQDSQRPLSTKHIITLVQAAIVPITPQHHSTAAQQNFLGSILTYLDRISSTTNKTPLPTYLTHHSLPTHQQPPLRLPSLPTSYYLLSFHSSLPHPHIITLSTRHQATKPPRLASTSYPT